MGNAKIIAGICVLASLVGGGAYQFGARRSPRIVVAKVLAQEGGRYAIDGSGYDAGETVSLELKNAPLTGPSGWHLGATAAANGKFSFQTEDFRCVHVDDPRLRERYNRQRVVFVATGLSSGRAATAVDTAGGILTCR